MLYDSPVGVARLVVVVVRQSPTFDCWQHCRDQDSNLGYYGHNRLVGGGGGSSSAAVGLDDVKENPPQSRKHNCLVLLLLGTRDSIRYDGPSIQLTTTATARKRWNPANFPYGKV
uniref:Uncharacterized protein n=1 Tax=Anopheles coluzzii TaxID=1518534 RepID=A0A8W7Q065_ANOCL